MEFVRRYTQNFRFKKSEAKIANRRLANLKISDFQEVAKQGIKPAWKAGWTFRVLMIALFFSEDVSYVVRELKEREEFQKFVGICEVPSEQQIYEFLSRFSEEQFINVILGILNRLSSARRRGRTCILVDSTDLKLDLNWIRRRITKKKLEDREFKWAYSPPKGYYIGFKLTMAVDYPSMQPLAFLVHEGSHNDSKLFHLIMDELQRGQIIRKGDIVIFDKGYYSYQNYQTGISLYKIVSLIFPRKDFKLNQALDRLSYPITAYQGGKIPEEIRMFFQRLKAEFTYKIQHWQEYKPIRSIIDDFFKLAKKHCL